MVTPKISDLIGIINKIASPALAEEWDNVGLQLGDPAAPVTRLMTALDPTEAAVAAATAAGCQLLVSHHPLFFSPLKRLSAAEPLGRLALRAVQAGLAVACLHTNYDSAAGGLNDVLAARLGLDGCEPLRAGGTAGMVKLVAFVPDGYEEPVLEALFRFSPRIGNYRDCSFRSTGVGTFHALEGARPHLGEVGARAAVTESRIEVLLERGMVAAAVKALVKAHPYEEPAFDLYPLLNDTPPHGLGRVGELAAETTLAAFAALVKERLGCQQLRMVGAGERPVRRVALCSGSGASLAREARFRGADVLVTGDVKYHEAQEALANGLALLDVGHFASELPFAAAVAERLRQELATRGFAAEVLVCSNEQDPFQPV